MTLEISRILVPIDFSSHSERALHYALMLAGRLGGTVDLLHVVEDPFASGAWNSEIAAIPNIADLRENLMEDGERRLERYRHFADEAGVPMVTTVRMGHPAQMVIDYAAAVAADLIVMGTHGRSGLQHVLMGSVAERVVRYAPCPVVTLRENTSRGEDQFRSEAREFSRAGD